MIIDTLYTVMRWEKIRWKNGLPGIFLLASTRRVAMEIIITVGEFLKLFLNVND